MSGFAALRCVRHVRPLVAVASLAAVPAATCPQVFAAASVVNPVQQAGETFVRLALQLAAIPGHAEEVDSYFGPASLRPAPGAPPTTVAALASKARALAAELAREERIAPSGRGERLLIRVRSFASLLEVIQHPHRWSFEQEAAHVYDMSMPAPDPATARILRSLDAVLPGHGDLSIRLEDFRSRFVVPRARRRAVFERALAACRLRTLRHWKLPADERLEIGWTSKVPAAWHRYWGGDRSTLEINADAVALVGSMIDVACHEAYPGHHAQFLLMTQRAGAAGLPIEDRIVLLRSPDSMLREGAANFGIDLAFPFKERVAFDRRVLFPLAGLDPAQAERYETVHRLVDRLSSSAAPILAAYRDGRLSFGVAASELTTEAMIASPAALLSFVDQYGAYALGYTAARDRIRDYVEMQSACTGADQWSVLAQVVSEPDVSVLRMRETSCAGHRKPHAASPRSSARDVSGETRTWGPRREKD